MSVYVEEMENKIMIIENKFVSIIGAGTGDVISALRRWEKSKRPSPRETSKHTKHEKCCAAARRKTEIHSVVNKTE